MSKYTYEIQSLLLDQQWVTIIKASREFCLGFMYAIRYESPSRAIRLIRSDGKILDEREERCEVFVGQIAGWVTPEQLELAASKAIDKAHHIRTLREKEKI